MAFVNSINVTVEGLELKSNYQGILLAYTANSQITNNNITNNYLGVWLERSFSNSVSGNNITNNTLYGIRLDASSNDNTVSGNHITNNTDYGVWLSSSSNNTVSGNTITNNTNAGVRLILSSNNSVSGNTITNNNDGILLIRSSNNSIAGNNITNNIRGVLLDSSSNNNTVSGNNITNNTIYGVVLQLSSNNNSISGNTITNSEASVRFSSSSFNTVSGNTITDNYFGVDISASSFSTVSGNTITNNNYGVQLSAFSSNDSISGNIITNNNHGVVLGASSNNTVSGNTITNNNYYGVYLYSSSNNNSISGNTITNNYNGVRLSSSSDNKFYHNNFINNTQQVYIPTSGYANFWDDGYPSGGNYWSDYTGVDFYSGPYQNITGSDSIGDTPYTIDANNQDRYPLMKTWPPHQINQTSVHIACKDYPITIESNATITKVVANPATLHFKTSGPDGTTGYIKVTFPVELNKTAIKVFIDGVKLTYPPFPIITTNGTHYFIYFEFTQSTHDITIQYAIADIAVTSVTTSKTVVGQGYTLTIKVAIQNQGNYTETFNATVYANTTIIATLTNVTLTNGTSTILTFTWNTTDFAKGNYTISAYAWPVPGEIETIDNYYTDGTVVVAMVGDVNADGIVNIIDLSIIGKAYGTYEGEPRYNPNADITGDGAIDIFDLATCAINYGTTDP